MFDSLRKKLAGWIGLGTKEKEEEPAKKVEKKEKIKEKVKKKEKIKEKIKEEKKPPKIKESEQKVEEPSKEVVQEISKAKEEPSQEEEIIEVEKELKAVMEEKQVEEPPEERGFFKKLIHKISSSKLTRKEFDEIFIELELTLLENNVALEVVDKIRENLASSLVDQQFKKSEAEKKIMQNLKNAILSVLSEPPNLIEQIKQKKGPFTIIFFGINGSGKTTSIAKLAHMLKKEGISCVLAAGDTFRAASIEQLEKHAEYLSVPLIKQNYGTDPAAVAFDAIQYAKKNDIKVILIDTAGRMYTKSNLIKEMEKIVRISQPDLKIFVGESITGNDAVDQAKTFNEAVGIDGIILSKADVDDKAGTILSVSQVTNKPIYFLGTGQQYKDLTPFTKKEVLKNLGLE